MTPADSQAAPANSQTPTSLRGWFLLDEVELGARVADSFAHATAP